MTTTYLPDVKVETIRPHGNNPRGDIGDVTELAASIRAVGLLEPLVVAPMNGSEYRLIAGHRRLAAAKDAGLTTVPALLREDLDTPPAQLEAMLVENTQRVDLTPVEEAQAYAQLVAFPGYTPTKAAKATGRSVKTVKARLAIATLPKATLDKMLDGQITIADAQTLAEYAGTPHFKTLSKAIGGYDFKFQVQRIRDRERDVKRVEQLREYFVEQGWTVADKQPADSRQVLSNWDARSASLTQLKAKLPDAGPYTLVVEDRPGGAPFWTVYRPLTDDEKAKEAKRDTGSGADRRSAWQEQKAARKAQMADLETARSVRAAYLTGRLGKLLLKDPERVDLLRLLVSDTLRNGDYYAEDLELAGIPADDDEGAPDHEWVTAANENQLWKALLVLHLRLGKNGDTWSPQTHAAPIRAAIALGYEPTDVERALITKDAGDE